MKFEDYIKSEDALFHYTKKSICFEQIIPSKKLRLSPIYKTNDPREYKNWLYNEWAFGDNAHFNTDKKGKAQIKLNNLRLNKSKVACFCSNIDYNDFYYHKKKPINHYGFEKSRMWSQYGQNHKGVCLVFSKQILEKQVKSLDDKLFSLSKPIDYRIIDALAYPDIQTNKLLRMDINEFCISELEQHNQLNYFIKDIDYVDESEFRIIIVTKEDGFIYLDINSSLKGILLGDNFNVTNKPKILLELAKKVNIKKIQYDKGKYITLNI